MNKPFSTIIFIKLFVIAKNGPPKRHCLHPNVISSRKSGCQLPSCMQIRVTNLTLNATTALISNTPEMLNSTPASALPITETTISPKAPSPSTCNSELVNTKSFDAVYAINIICMYYIVVFIFLCFSKDLDIAQRKVNGVLDLKHQQQQ